MSFHYALPGSSAIGPHGARRLLARLQVVEPAANAVEAYHFYLVCSSSALSGDDRLRLQALLDEAPAPDTSASDDAMSIHVTARVGTLSAWSTKATDIAHNCAMSQIERIERGLHYRIRRKGGLFGLGRSAAPEPSLLPRLASVLHDRMTESWFAEAPDPERLFNDLQGRPLSAIPLHTDGRGALLAANQAYGLALSDDEIDYLMAAYASMKRDPTEVELMMFAQANSEHCRHKIFNARFSIDGIEQPSSLFGMIKATHAAHPAGTAVAYSDNAAVLDGRVIDTWTPAQADGANGQYRWSSRQVQRLLKVETHNHPTAIAPHPGAATGAGGEIRDEGATGRGGTPRYGLTGFTVSHLRIPGWPQAWEPAAGQGHEPAPDTIASPLSIMIDGPLGAAAFNNEFGRPNLLGYFRTFETPLQAVPNGLRGFGYHKPIMLAGGVGSVDRQHQEKLDLPPGTLLAQIGGPGMRIGLGGSAASSMGVGSNSAELDFASVQRANAEMQRRAQEVIDACRGFADDNPILSIHDVGAGGLSNALPELAHGSDRGARFSLERIPVMESGMSAAEIWCNESQERYVLAVAPERAALLQYLCERERCPFDVLGEVTAEQTLQVAGPDDRLAVDMSMNVLFGKPPRMHRHGRTRATRVEHADTGSPVQGSDLGGLDVAEVGLSVLRLPAVASKSFLITIGDRTVGGLTARDQMVGPWQVPVADCAVGLLGYRGHEGDALAIGERSPIATIDPAAASRMAIGEALTNLLAACPQSLGDVKLSANWMADCGPAENDADLFRAVEAASRFCIALGISIPVGKDSLSMRTRWRKGDTAVEVGSPVSLVATAHAPVADVREALTPQLAPRLDTSLILVDLGRGHKRLGASALAQVTGRHGDPAPDVEAPEDLVKLHAAVREARTRGWLLAFHDRSDGGLFTTLCEMAFAGHCGLSVNVDMLTIDPHAADWGDFRIRPEQVAVQRAELVLRALFNEELGVVVQVARADRDRMLGLLREHGLSAHAHVLGSTNDRDTVEIQADAKTVFSLPRATLLQAWSETSQRIAKLRDDPDSVDEASLLLGADGTAQAPLSVAVDGDLKVAGSGPARGPAVPAAGGRRPRVAVLREQGVNSHREMAAAFDLAGFDAYDVHMSDLSAGRHRLADFQVLVACGGFSYGDVLGAGIGWAKSVLFNVRLAEEFSRFFSRPDTLSLGVCNGCQMMSQLKSIIPGASAWPRFVRNRSQQYEARFAQVEVMDSPSLLLAGMSGWRLPIVVAHGEGRVQFDTPSGTPGSAAVRAALPVMRFVDGAGRPTERYPLNPNGSGEGLTGFCSDDGRSTILMPHPERVFRLAQWSWCPDELKEAGEDHSPWMRLWHNARSQFK